MQKRLVAPEKCHLRSLIQVCWGPLWRPVSTVKIDQVLIMQMMASFVHCMTQVTLHFDTEYELRLCADTDSKMAAPVYPL